MSAKGLRVFVVEDEPMIRMLIVDMLEELGCRVAAEGGDVEEAAELAQSTDFDLAILDVNLKGKLITPVAELIRRAGARSFSQPAMARKACRKNFEIFRRSRSPSSRTPWQP
jgi:CheY-like chemotaxis protein